MRRGLARVGVGQGTVDIDKNLLAAQRPIAIDRRVFQLIPPQLDFHAVARRGNRHVFQSGHIDARAAGDMNPGSIRDRRVKHLPDRIIA